MNKTIKLTALLLVLSANVNAADKKADADFVVATVNGTKIMLSEVQDVKENANPQLAALPMNAVFDPLLENLVDMTIISEAAKADKVQNTAEFKKMMKSVEKQLLARLYLERQAKKKANQSQAVGNV